MSEGLLQFLCLIHLSCVPIANSRRKENIIKTRNNCEFEFVPKLKINAMIKWYKSEFNEKAVDSTVSPKGLFRQPLKLEAFSKKGRFHGIEDFPFVKTIWVIFLECSVDLARVPYRKIRPWSCLSLFDRGLGQHRTIISTFRQRSES